ncbi:MAG: DUF3619 family protein [Rhodocyclales bacterium]|nr:DUF3619 family protein [Rhodocyclales bacterium]
MNQDSEFGYKTRQILNEGLDHLNGAVARRLHEARQSALSKQRQPVGMLSFAGIGHGIDFNFGGQARTVVAILALAIGATGTYYWNAFAQVQELEEIDSALLADELPPSAYLDRGFHAWLERGSDSSSQ